LAYRANPRRQKATGKPAPTKVGFIMIMNDPSTDMLTRIRNAQLPDTKRSSCPSEQQKAIAKILSDEAMSNPSTYRRPLQANQITLKYVQGNSP
jgi:ribosomal protein S8